MSYNLNMKKLFCGLIVRSIFSFLKLIFTIPKINFHYKQSMKKICNVGLESHPRFRIMSRWGDTLPATTIFSSGEPIPIASCAFQPSTFHLSAYCTCQRHTLARYLKISYSETLIAKYTWTTGAGLVSSI